MIVELVGLPGSGKSTFARALESKEGFTRVRIGGRVELLFYNALFFFCHPIRFTRLFIWTMRDLGSSGFRYAKFVNCFLVHNATYRKAGRYQKAVIDQGHAQNIVSLFERTISEDKMNAFVHLIPHADVLVIFDVPEDERVRRLTVRGYGVRPGMEQAAKDAWLAASEKNFSRFVRRAAAGDFPTTVLRVDDSPNSSDRAIDVLRNPIVRYVMNVRMPTEKAHGVQIYRSLEALIQLGIPAELWIPDRKNPITESIDQYYDSGVARTEAALGRIAVRRFRLPDMIRLFAPLGPIAHWLSEACFALALLCMRTDRTAIYYTRSALVARVLAGKGLRVVYEAHVWPTSKSTVFAWLIRGAELIAANSEGTSDVYRSHGFANIHVAPNGVQLDAYGAMTQADARKTLSLPEKQTVLYLGAFYAWKGAPFLASAWAEYFRDREDIQLVMVGGDIDLLIREGASEDIRRAKNLVVVPHQHVRLVPHYLAAADVLTLPLIPVTEEAKHYTSPIKLFEYLASGRPIVASDLPSVRNILSDDMAVFFPPGDGKALAARVTDMLSGASRSIAEERFVRIRESGVLSQYTWDTRMKGIMEKLSRTA